MTNMVYANWHVYDAEQVKRLERFGEACKHWQALLGPNRILSDEETLDRYAQSSSSYNTRPLAVLQPRSTEEVSLIVKTAGQFQIPLYSISGGRNWGYGDACAVTDGR